MITNSRVRVKGKRYSDEVIGKRTGCTIKSAQIKPTAKRIF